MATPSGPGPEGSDPPEGGPRYVEEDYSPPPRRRPSLLRLVAMAVLSIIVTAVLFRMVVEAVRWAMEP
jgi:hypothetical protein